MTLPAARFAEGSTQLVWTLRLHNFTTIRAAVMRTSLSTSWRSWKSSPKIILIVSAALLLLLKLACNSQLFYRSVGLPSPAAASPSTAATATATATTSPSWPTWPALRIRDYSMEYDCSGCDVAWWLGMVSVIGFRIPFVCYLVLGFVDIS